MSGASRKAERPGLLWPWRWSPTGSSGSPPFLVTRPGCSLERIVDSILRPGGAASPRTLCGRSSVACATAPSSHPSACFRRQRAGEPERRSQGLRGVRNSPIRSRRSGELPSTGQAGSSANPSPTAAHWTRGKYARRAGESAAFPAFNSDWETASWQSRKRASPAKPRHKRQDFGETRQDRFATA